MGNTFLNPGLTNSNVSRGQSARWVASLLQADRKQWGLWNPEEYVPQRKGAAAAQCQIAPIWNAGLVSNLIFFSGKAKHLNFYANLPIISCQQLIQIFKPRKDQENMSRQDQGDKGREQLLEPRQCCVAKAALRGAKTFLPDHGQPEPTLQ